MSAQKKIVPALLLLGGLAACDGDDDTAAFDADLTPPIDAAPDAPPDIDATPGDTLTGTELSEAGDFSRVGCVPGSLAGLEFDGVWHLDTRTDYGGGYVDQFAASVRLNPADEAGSRPEQVNLNGTLTNDVKRDDDDLIARVVTLASGARRISAIDVCKQDDDGSLSGAFANCDERNVRRGQPLCVHGTFRAVRVRPLDEPPSQGLTLLGEYVGTELQPWNGRALPVNVRVRDNLAFVVNHNDGLRIIDVSDPAAMTEVGHHYNPVGYNDVKLTERASDGRRYALCSSDQHGVDVIDVTDPSSPVPVTRFSEFGSVHTLFIETHGGQTRAYLPDYSRTGTKEEPGYAPSLTVWNIDDPENPALLASYLLPEDEIEGSGFIHDLMVKDGIAYLNTWYRGFLWVNTNDPAAIAQVGAFDDYERRTSHSNWVTEVNGCLVAVHGDEDFGAHLRTIGVDPRPSCAGQFQKQLGEFQLRPEVSIHNIMAFGDVAYVAYYQDGVRLFDISDPAAPQPLAWYNTWEGGPGLSFFEGATGIDVDLEAKRIYVADIPRGLLVLAID